MHLQLKHFTVWSLCGGCKRAHYHYVCSKCTPRSSCQESITNKSFGMHSNSHMTWFFYLFISCWPFINIHSLNKRIWLNALFYRHKKHASQILFLHDSHFMPYTHIKKKNANWHCVKLCRESTTSLHLSRPLNMHESAYSFSLLLQSTSAALAVSTLYEWAHLTPINNQRLLEWVALYLYSGLPKELIVEYSCIKLEPLVFVFVVLCMILCCLSLVEEKHCIHKCF